MRGGGDGWFVMLAAGAIALGIGIHFVITGGKGEGSGTRPPARERVFVVPGEPVGSPRALEGTPALDDPEKYDLSPETREALGAYKDQLKARARAGEASDLERRTLRALCRQLGDTGCSN